MDATTRGLVRAAEAERTPEAWLRAAAGLRRAGHVDEAGRASLHVVALGGDPAVVGLEAPPLEAFAPPRLISERFSLGRVHALAWAADAGALFAGVGEAGVVVALDPGSGAARTVGAVPGRVRALGADLEGRRLAVAWVEGPAPGPGDGTVVAALDAASGQVLARRPLAREWFDAVTLVGPAGHLLAASRRAVRAWAVDDLGARRAPWVVTGDLVALGPGGFAAALRGRRLLLFDPLAKAPRVDVEGEATADGAGALLAAGRGAVVWDRLGVGLGARARRIAPDGAAGPALPLVGEPRVDGAVASPCGRLLAHLVVPAGGAGRVTRASAVVLVDLEARASRRVDLGGPLPRSLAWAPSGAALAVGTDEGTVALLDARPAPATAATTPATTSATTPATTSASATSGAAAWVELVRGDRFWRVRAVPDGVEVHFGTRGTAGRRLRSAADDPPREAERRLRAKRREGFAPVADPGPRAS